MKLANTLLIFGLAMTTLLSASNPHMPDHKHCPILCPITPINPNDDCCHNLHLDIGLLYQQPYIPGMNAGQEYEDDSQQSGDDPDYTWENLNPLNECFDYALGLTASLGYLMEHDNWYFGARFDWVSANTSSTYDVNDESTKELLVILPYVGMTGNSPLDSYAEAIYDLNGDSFSKITYTAFIDIYALDILLSRGSFHTKCFSYEPFAGVKALWFSSTQNPRYYDTSDSGALLTKQNNWGAGPMFGFNAKYYFVENIAIFSDSDIALLFGNADQTSVVFSSSDATRLISNINCMIYIPVRSILGVEFSQYCLEDTHYVALKIGYDLRAVIAMQDFSRGFTMNGLYTNLVWNF